MTTSTPSQVTNEVVTAGDRAMHVIGDYVQELNARIEKARAFAPEVALARDFIGVFGALCGPAPDIEWYLSKLRVSLSLDPGTVNALMLNFDATELAQVTEPLRWLATRLGKYTIEDYPELGRRAYVFGNGDRPVRFQVFFNSNTSVCKFVQIGVEEKPVYKLTCEGAA